MHETVAGNEVGEAINKQTISSKHKGFDVKTDNS